MLFMKCFGVFLKVTIEDDSLGRETSAGSLGLLDAAEPAEGICYGNACPKETTAPMLSRAERVPHHVIS